MQNKISVIIPLSSNETGRDELIAQLPEDFEVVLSQEDGRAASLNAGAACASGDYLWFLHADSRLAMDAVDKLLSAITKYPDDLLYFDLAFDGGRWMGLNAIGANFRSGFLKTPFGDQGFCVSRKIFEKLGGFPEGLPYGEDHMFVINARRFGVCLRSVGAKIYTSARKYEENGWVRTTILHQYLWMKQALGSRC